MEIISFNYSFNIALYLNFIIYDSFILVLSFRTKLEISVLIEFIVFNTIFYDLDWILSLYLFYKNDRLSFQNYKVICY